MSKDNYLTSLCEERHKFKKDSEEYKECLENIMLKIYCIGGPLNDNILKFNNRQLKVFQDIVDEIRSVL